MMLMCLIRSAGNQFFLYSDRYGKGNGTAGELISKGAYIHFGSIMFRKTTICNHRFNNQLYMGEDWLFSIDVLMGGNRKFHYVDEVLSKYRRHTSNKTYNWERKIRNNFKMLERIETVYPLMKNEIRSRRGELYFISAVYNFLNWEIVAASKAIIRYFLISFPKIFRFSRILYRELKFFVNNKFKFDLLVKSLRTPLRDS